MAERQFDDAAAWVLSTPQGRLFLHHLIHAPEACGLDRNPYVPDSNGLVLNVGRQSVGHWLKAELERVDASLFARLMVEAQDASRKPSRPHVPVDGDSSRDG